MAKKLILFDLDNTVLWSGDATARAFKQAFADLFGVEDAFAGIDLQYAGRTDTIILHEALDRHGVSGEVEDLTRQFRQRYHEVLPGCLATAEAKRTPGIEELLTGLAEAGATLGLVTGNSRQAAMLKIEHCGVDSSHFADGAFGDDDEDRSVLVGMAMKRLAAEADPKTVVMVGDTPSDVKAAKNNGATSIAVATGKWSVDQLKEAGADIAFEDFSDWRGALQSFLA
ncbi:MAG: HAD family hydrolase [Chloroflexi bacterium]|nr:HAD family hydrolase [Chloroflexota bacterium]